MTKAITEFTGEHRFLSNFWPASVVYEDVEYPTVEHAYQAAKTLGLPARMVIAAAGSAGQAKRLGSRVAIRADWEDIKVGVMTDLVRQKFTRSPNLGTYLRATWDRELVEGNHWGDQFWGVCRGVGKNHLGHILMKVRTELQEGT